MNIKLIIAFIIAQTVFSGIKAHAQFSTNGATLNNCTTQIVTLVATSGGSAGQFPLTPNQIVTLNNMGLSAGVNPGGGVYFNYLNGGYTSYGTSTSGAGLPLTYTGLTSITLTNGTTTIQGLTISATFTILTPSTNTVTYTPANSVVIPSDANGNVQIILQSSSDLVNWVPSMPGTYGSTYTNRFFRVIAVAQ